MPHRVAPRARADLDEIWHYIATESGSEQAADRTVDSILDRLLLLSRWPRLGRSRNDLRRGLRSYGIGNYVIFYRISRAGVVILRVLHARRDIRRLFQS
jgi:toxin ParE1/3/4